MDHSAFGSDAKLYAAMVRERDAAEVAYERAKIELNKLQEDLRELRKHLNVYVDRDAPRKATANEDGTIVTICHSDYGEASVCVYGKDGNAGKT